MADPLTENERTRRARDLLKVYDETFTHFKIRVKNEIDKINKHYSLCDTEERTSSANTKPALSQRFTVKSKGTRLNTSIPPHKEKDAKSKTKSRNALLSFNGEVGSIICEDNYSEVCEDLFTYKATQSQMTKNEQRYILELEKARERLNDPNNQLPIEVDQTEKDRIVEQLKLQALCNDNKAFQKYKKGTLFDDKVNIMELVRKGKAEDRFKRRNDSVVDEISNVQAEPKKKESVNMFRNTMEKFQNLGNVQTHRKFDSDKSEFLEPHTIKVLPPSTPRKINLKKGLSLMNQTLNSKFSNYSKNHRRMQDKLNSTLNTSRWKGLSRGSKNRNSLVTQRRFENTDTTRNRSSFLITEETLNNAKHRK
ncbi:unnamed protein product [Moneuplotes crassus]|uniref:Uncharacterized protein n=1 Tax=Euplotes crassus TaxID=5936 RepID=A0AAD1Y4R6_EUPCR|nr:unnamed protein product [Moneuplotes crassus]